MTFEEDLREIKILLEKILKNHYSSLGNGPVTFNIQNSKVVSLDNGVNISGKQDLSNLK